MANEGLGKKDTIINVAAGSLGTTYTTFVLRAKGADHLVLTGTMTVGASTSADLRVRTSRDGVTYRDRYHRAFTADATPRVVIDDLQTYEQYVEVGAARVGSAGAGAVVAARFSSAKLPISS